MKHTVGLFLSLLLLLSFAACGTQEIQVPEYDPTVEEYSDLFMYINMTFTVYDCSAIIKAVYLGKIEPYTEGRVYYKFKVEEDFTGLADEEIIHVQDSTRAVYVPGKSYYLFMRGMYAAYNPFVSYARITGDLIGEVPAKYSETGESYYTGLLDEWKDVEDLSAYIRSEIIDKQRYYINSPMYTHEPFEDAYRNADVVTLVTVTQVEQGRSFQSCECVVEIVEELKGEYFQQKVHFNNYTDEELKELGWTRGVQPEFDIETVAWADTKVGDQLVLLYKDVTGGVILDLYSLENYMFRAESPEGKWIIETARAEKASSVPETGTEQQ